MTGEDPSDWKPMPSIGPGVREIRIRQAFGAFRIIYLATISDVVHVRVPEENSSDSQAGYRHR